MPMITQVIHLYALCLMILVINGVILHQNSLSPEENRVRQHGRSKKLNGSSERDESDENWRSVEDYDYDGGDKDSHKSDEGSKSSSSSGSTSSETIESSIETDENNVFDICECSESDENEDSSESGETRSSNKTDDSGEISNEDMFWNMNFTDFSPENVLLGACFCGVPNTGQINTLNGTDYIIGGAITEDYEYPWQVSLINCHGDDACLADDLRDLVSCGGTLVTDIHVITAAHCLHKKGTRPPKWFNETKIKVLLGETNLLSKNKKMIIGSQKFNVHPRYEPPSYEHDIAVIVLKRNVSLFKYPNIKPACLPIIKEKEKTPVDGWYYNKTAIVSGFGLNGSWNRITNPRKFLPSKLKEMHVKVMGRKNCGKFIDFLNTSILNATMLCGYSGGEGDSCKGDSGGPLITNDEDNLGAATLIGTVSMGYSNCDSKMAYQIYTSIKYYMMESSAWLNETLKSGMKCSPWPGLKWSKLLDDPANNTLHPINIENGTQLKENSTEKPQILENKTQIIQTEAPDSTNISAPTTAPIPTSIQSQSSEAPTNISAPITVPVPTTVHSQSSEATTTISAPTNVSAPITVPVPTTVSAPTTVSIPITVPVPATILAPTTVSMTTTVPVPTTILAPTTVSMPTTVPVPTTVPGPSSEGCRGRANGNGVGNVGNGNGAFNRGSHHGVENVGSNNGVLNIGCKNGVRNIGNGNGVVNIGSGNGVENIGSGNGVGNIGDGGQIYCNNTGVTEICDANRKLNGTRFFSALLLFICKRCETGKAGIAPTEQFKPPSGPMEENQIFKEKGLFGPGGPFNPNNTEKIKSNIKEGGKGLLNILPKDLIG